ncbi:UDP-N-acetylglucosamine--undecaprenyl-phosphate N-acetylglucosaminephosphotransferase [Methylobacter sp. sgz302048]|uniref:UDP-N-acetylglucosamine--undecaprenyl-phosphate N-acetylglucosaminephosphotransferase n=1 Tax=Methylobacter sp. sgz302048 TaxID=3455945 RepID=UPI003FA0D02F
MFNTHLFWYSVTLCFFMTLLAIIVLKPIAAKVGLTDQPNSRKKHQGEIPLIGGLTIYLSVFSMQNLIGQANTAYLAAAGLIILCGLADDFKNISFKIRLVIEIIASLIMIKWAGYEITSLDNLFGFGEIQLGAFSTVFTVFAVVGGINAFNMIDGIDGLAGSMALLIFVIFAILEALFPSSNISIPLLLIIPSVLAFLLFNLRIFGKKKASVFLGDAGSMLLGFTICWLIISASQGQERIISPVTALWVIAIPVLDTVCIMLRRFFEGKSVFDADRNHIHHILIDAGFGVNQTLVIILFFSATLTTFGLAADILFNIPAWFMFYLFISLFITYYLAVIFSSRVMKGSRHLEENTLKEANF